MQQIIEKVLKALSFTLEDCLKRAAAQDDYMVTLQLDMREVSKTVLGTSWPELKEELKAYKS